MERIPAPPIIQVDEETKQAMQNVQGNVAQIVEHENWNGEQLTGIRTQVDTVLHELRQMPKTTASRLEQPAHPTSDFPPPPAVDVSQITERLDEMGTTLNANIPELLMKVEALMKQASALQRAKSVVVMKDLPAVPRAAESEAGLPDETQETTLAEAGAKDSGVLNVDGTEPQAEQSTKLELFDPTQLEAKLDVLLHLCQQLRTEPPARTPSSGAEAGSEKLEDSSGGDVDSAAGEGGILPPTPPNVEVSSRVMTSGLRD